jgi:riboflavin-specific deaminase-like protein
MEPTDFFDALVASPAPPSRPLTILAWAQTLDGSVAWPDGSPLTISSPASFRFTHRLRAYCDGIMVGVGTVLADDPRLTARDASGRQPRPVILDTNLRVPPSARALNHPRPPLILTGPAPNKDRLRVLQARGAEIIPLPLGRDGRVHLVAGLSALRERGIRTLMVEGGPSVHAALLRAGLADWLALTISPMLLGGLPALQPVAAPGQPIPALTAWRIQTNGPDLLIWGAIDK